MTTKSTGRKNDHRFGDSAADPFAFFSASDMRMSLAFSGQYRKVVPSGDAITLRLLQCEAGWLSAVKAGALP